MTDAEQTGLVEGVADKAGVLNKKSTGGKNFDSEKNEKDKSPDLKPHPADSNKKQIAVPPAPTRASKIPPPIKPRNLNEPLSKQLKNDGVNKRADVKNILSPDPNPSGKPLKQGSLPHVKSQNFPSQPGEAAKTFSQPAADQKTVGTRTGQVIAPAGEIKHALPKVDTARLVNTEPAVPVAAMTGSAGAVADAQAKVTEPKLGVATQEASPKEHASAQPDPSASNLQVQSPSGTTMHLKSPPQGPAKLLSPQISPQQPIPPRVQAGAMPESGATHAPLPPPPTAAANRAMAVGKGNVSLNFDDADIYSVIQTVFGEILKVNYIIDARVKGRVTFRSVAPVPREKVLPLMEVILRLNGVAIIEESELYRIIPISDLSREPSEIKIGRKIIDADLKGKAVLQIIPLNYMQSSEIVKLINPFVSTNAVIVDVPKANHIIIADTDANVKRILNMIEYFDAEMKEKKGVRVFVHHVQNAMAKDVVTMLQQIYLGAKTQTSDRVGKPASSGHIATSTPQAQPVMVSTQSGGIDAIVSEATKIFADEKLNAVVILGTREDYDIIKATIKELDLIPRQVLIEGTIASIQLTDKMSLGLAWAFKNKFLNFESFDVSFNPSTLTNVKTNGATASGLNLIGIDDVGAVRVVINALASQSKAKLLASPHIMVADNNEARIQVGQQVPIPTSETYGSTTVAPQRTIQYKDIGIILKVKPLINDGGFVTLQISQEVSTYTKDILYDNQMQIILNKTEATTKLIVKDGHTIVIGGLIREDDNNARAGLPWLSKIPILGYLFGNTDTDKNKTELVILLTPYIVKDQNDAMSITSTFVGKFKDERMTEDIQNNVHGKPKESKESKKEKEKAIKKVE